MVSSKINIQPHKEVKKTYMAMNCGDDRYLCETFQQRRRRKTTSMLLELERVCELREEMEYRVND